MRKDVMVGYKMFPKYSCIEGLVPSAMARAGPFESVLDLEVFDRVNRLIH